MTDCKHWQVTIPIVNSPLCSFLIERIPQIIPAHAAVAFFSSQQKDPDWTVQEVEALVEGVMRHRHALFAKFTPSITFHKKNELWKEIVGMLI